MFNYALTHNPDVKLVKRDYYNHRRKHIRKKVIVFDLDETIGHFSHLHPITKCLSKLFDRELYQDEFNKLLDVFPEFFRPGILTVLEFLKIKKDKNNVFKIYIYTNNQCNPPWVNMIVNYIQRKLNAPNLFDKLICAFKIRNQIIELGRTCSAKTYSDFIKCTMLPEDIIETCFIDNTYHDKMCKDRVYYILPKSYYHTLKKETIIRRVLSIFTSNNQLQKLLTDSLEENRNISLVNEGAITKKIMYYVREFLYYPRYPHTHKTKRSYNKRAGTKKNTTKTI